MRISRGGRVPLVLGPVGPLAWIDAVYQMGRAARTLGGGRLRRANGQRPIDLPRIGRDDLPAYALRDAHGERALTGRGRADDRDHVRTAASTARSAARARSTDA